MSNNQSHITIREANGGDGDALARLAQLDSGRPPVSPAVIAEVDGEPRAAISIPDGTVVADPFHRTEELVAMLRLRAGLVPGRLGSGVRALGRSRWGSDRPRPQGPAPSAPSIPGIPAIPGRIA